MAAPFTVPLHVPPDLTPELGFNPFLLQPHLLNNPLGGETGTTRKPYPGPAFPPPPIAEPTTAPPPALAEPAALPAPVPVPRNPLDPPEPPVVTFTTRIASKRTTPPEVQPTGPTGKNNLPLLLRATILVLKALTDFTQSELSTTLALPPSVINRTYTTAISRGFNPSSRPFTLEENWLVDRDKLPQPAPQPVPVVKLVERRCAVCVAREKEERKAAERAERERRKEEERVRREEERRVWEAEKEVRRGILRAAAEELRAARKAEAAKNGGGRKRKRKGDGDGGEGGKGDGIEATGGEGEAVVKRKRVRRKKVAETEGGTETTTGTEAPTEETERQEPATTAPTTAPAKRKRAPRKKPPPATSSAVASDSTGPTVSASDPATSSGSPSPPASASAPAAVPDPPLPPPPPRKKKPKQKNRVYYSKTERMEKVVLMVPTEDFTMPMTGAVSRDQGDEAVGDGGASGTRVGGEGKSAVEGASGMNLGEDGDAPSDAVASKHGGSEGVTTGDDEASALKDNLKAHDQVESNGEISQPAATLASPETTPPPARTGEDKASTANDEGNTHNQEQSPLTKPKRTPGEILIDAVSQALADTSPLETADVDGLFDEMEEL